MPSQTKKKKRLEYCSRAPSSQICRKAVYLSKTKARLRSGGPVRNRSMTKNRLARNSRGKIVSKKKSKQAKRRYDSGRNGIKMWNEAARAWLSVQEQSPYDDYVPPDDMGPPLPYEDFIPPPLDTGSLPWFGSAAVAMRSPLVIVGSMFKTDNGVFKKVRKAEKSKGYVRIR